MKEYSEPGLTILGSDDDSSVHTYRFQDKSVVAMATERGEKYRKVQKENQDRVATGMLVMKDGREINVDVVCDGLGGYPRGFEASPLFCE